MNTCHLPPLTFSPSTEEQDVELGGVGGGSLWEEETLSKPIQIKSLVDLALRPRTDKCKTSVLLEWIPHAKTIQKSLENLQNYPEFCQKRSEHHGHGLQ